MYYDAIRFFGYPFPVSYQNLNKRLKHSIIFIDYNLLERFTLTEVDDFTCFVRCYWYFSKNTFNVLLKAADRFL